MTALALTQTLAARIDTSDVSDLDKFEEAYSDWCSHCWGGPTYTGLERDCSGHTNEGVPGLDLPGGLEALYSLANVPKSWPLARLTIH